MDNPREDLGKLLIRLMLGAVVLLHGIGKLLDDFGSVMAVLNAQGLPVMLAWAVVLGEIVGPALLVFGLYARVGAALIALNTLAGIVLAHRAELLHLDSHGGWALEFQGLVLFTALGLLLIGPGRYRLGRD